MANSTGPQMAFYGAQDMSNYGYPEGVSIVDFVRPEIKPHVHQHWYNFPPVNPMWHYLLGVIYLCLCVISIIGNGLVIYLFSKCKALRTPANILVVNLAFSDLIMLTTNVPFFTYNCFNGGVWMFSYAYCEIYATLGAFTGTNCIWLLCMISFDRYNIICNGFNGPKLTTGKAIFLTMVSWAISIVCAASPLFGWGRYTLEGILTSCSFDYLTQNFNIYTYNIFIFIFEYFLPGGIIIISYVFIVKAIFAHEAAMRAQAKKMNVATLRSGESDSQRAEIRIAKTALVNVSLWFICWTPYAIMSLQGVMGHISNITPLVSTLPALLAKSCSCYNPFVYAISHPKYRLAITQHMPWFCVHEVERKSTDDSQSNSTVAQEKA
ncbi:compound eye opsin BCRH2-like [Portunus trituberculatus]|uniref:compound eye opsin BCRH2-like n=1 Tax=Portunus trituberculatus TaxID=210409 RepID=UPI001E1D1762|nr:compound eye opsin BCRH2-like [Portunus trituberculatus]